MRLRDAQWDRAVTDLSGRAFLAAGKDAGKSPYAPLFGTLPASAATRLGPAKATEVGERYLRNGRELNHAELNPHLETLGEATTRLREAGAARSEAQRDAQAHEIKRIVAKEQLELLIAETEVAILTSFVGRADLVRAVLGPEPERPSSDAADEPADVPPPVG